ncbi:response regulator transcription factor [Microbacterium sp.]|uniref:response regulator transcription factor n=1 Tax=Microbacterium sp. TaxID=51671 RepID=UPI00333F3EBA
MGSTPRSRRRLSHLDGSPVRVLVVDDEPGLCDVLALALRHEGWVVRTAMSGAEAIRAAREMRPDAVVLDVMLPDFDGNAVLRRLRENGDDMPVLFLTAKDALADRLHGLNSGGDDYVTKPFDLREVVARLRSLIRRTARMVDEDTGPQVRVGDLVLDEETYDVSRDGTPIDLSPTEFELLRFLMQNARRVHNKLDILERVWDADYTGKPSVVDLYISYLRKKIDSLGPPMIHTVRGVGYMLRPSSDPQPDGDG